MSVACGLAALPAAAEPIDPAAIERAAAAVDARVIGWRRDIHQHPELSNREVRTAAVVARHLQSLGLDVRTSVARTGVVATLTGARPGPVLALRADMDALPVKESTDALFASRTRTSYRGETVDVMHACGHDAHTAILMGAAEVLAQLRESLAGTVLFIFQPAEEGAPEGEEGGASLMLKEGVFARGKPSAIFALHVSASLEVGEISVREGPIMAASDGFRIVVEGRPTHGAKPWTGIDPIVASTHIVQGLQTIVSRQIDLTAFPAVITIGAIRGGTRGNIIAQQVEMLGTLRTFDEGQRGEILARMHRTVSQHAQAHGANATLVLESSGNPLTVNDPGLTSSMMPILAAVAREGGLRVAAPATIAEDFAYFAREVPALYFHVGVTTPGTPMQKIASNHSSGFTIDERGIGIGLRALLHLTVAYLQ